MDYLLDLLQGLGIAAAIGIRPFLPVLLAGALAAANLGIDFEGTDFSFLEGTAFLLVIVALVAVFGFIDRRRRGAEYEGNDLEMVVLLGISLVLGVLLASGSIADNFATWWPGIPVGIAAASLGFFAARSLFGRVRARLDPEAQGALPVYAEGAALLAAGASILLPPLAILVVAGLAWLMLGGKRRQGEKYAGLRILR